MTPKTANVRAFLARFGALRTIHRRLVRARRSVVVRLFKRLRFETIPPEVAVRLMYEVMLQREPDPVGFTESMNRLTSGEFTPAELVQAVRGSEEFQTRPAFSDRTFGASIHAGRCQFIRELPAARRIVDLGGTHLGNDSGAMVGLGYPYSFEELVIIDLPAEDRHAIYKSRQVERVVPTERGPVRYQYHSMTDLSRFADSTVDLVYSGQSIEHVTPDDGMVVLKESFRILRPGGHLALDTPNARVTRLQQDDFIDPDHKVEYTWPELSEMLESAGFEILAGKGLNYAGPSLAAGRFDIDQVAGASGIYAELEDCYILCAVARKPV